MWTIQALSLLVPLKGAPYSTDFHEHIYEKHRILRLLLVCSLSRYLYAICPNVVQWVKLAAFYTECVLCTVRTLQTGCANLDVFFQWGPYSTHFMVLFKRTQTQA